MKALFLLLILSVPAYSQTRTQCPLRWMFQYDPAAQVNAEASVNDDSTTSYLIAWSLHASTISPSVGFTVTTADSFSVDLRTDSGVFITIQHDGPSNTFITDTTFAGPIFWHPVVIHVTPGQHNYSVMLYPIALIGPLIPTIFNVPVFIGAAYAWNRAPAPPAGILPNRQPAIIENEQWFDILSREVNIHDMLLPHGMYFSRDSRKIIR
jgi:hypothetical protein